MALQTTRRRFGRMGIIAAVVGIFAALAPAASADITGGVTSSAGSPLYNVRVAAVDATGASAGSD